MPFSLPVFNLQANLWYRPRNPRTDPPDITGFDCQLNRDAKQVAIGSSAFLRMEESTALLMVMPLGPDITNNPIIECPAGTGAFFTLNRAIWMHRGFVNEYVSANIGPVLVSASGLSIVHSNTDTDLM